VVKSRCLLKIQSGLTYQNARSQSCSSGDVRWALTVCSKSCASVGEVSRGSAPIFMRRELNRLAAVREKCDHIVNGLVLAWRSSGNYVSDDPPKLTFIPGVVLTSNSTTTLSSSNPQTQDALFHAINQLRENAPNTTIAPSTGHYITPVGDSRVVWTRQDDKILVVTIFAPST